MNMSGTKCTGMAKGKGGYSKHTQRQYIYSNLILVDVTKTKQKLWSIHERG